MKVILIKDVGGVGRRDEVKDVSDGFAMNSLIPRGLAVQATKEQIAALSKKKSVQDAASAQEDKRWADIVRHLNGANLVVAAKANEQGHLYQALNLETITQGIRHEYGVEVPVDSFAINAPLRSVGESQIEIRHGEHRARFTVTVIAAA